VEVFAVANGPGQFTGLRVGLALVKGFAETLQRPVVEVGYMEALCEAAEAEGVLAPLVDARRGEVFAALYVKQGGELVEQRPVAVLPLKEFLPQLEADGVVPESVTFVTSRNEDGEADNVGTPFSDSRQAVVSPVLAEAVARCARRKFAHGETVDALHLKPNYVRLPDAALPGKRGK
jgi:tRNA threonylcarbamoyladenosine biosynthesis protein TsaB